MPFTEVAPKWLVRVGQDPILFYQLKSLEKVGVTNITIVTGYYANKIKAYTAESFPHLKINFVNNPQYAETDDMYSLYLAKEEWRENSIHINSDVLFHPALLTKLISSNNSSICVQKRTCGEEEMKACVLDDGRVSKLSKEVAPASAIGESMGLYLLYKNFSDELLKAIESLIRSNRFKENRSAAINAILSNGIPLYSIDVTEYPAVEIDFPEDLEYANEVVLPKIIDDILATYINE